MDLSPFQASATPWKPSLHWEGHDNVWWVCLEKLVIFTGVEADGSSNAQIKKARWSHSFLPGTVEPQDQPSWKPAPPIVFAFTSAGAHPLSPFRLTFLPFATQTFVYTDIQDILDCYLRQFKMEKQESEDKDLQTQVYYLQMMELRSSESWALILNNFLLCHIPTSITQTSSWLKCCSRFLLQSQILVPHFPSMTRLHSIIPSVRRVNALLSTF